MVKVIESGNLGLPLRLPVSINSKFDKELLQRHIDEASAFVMHCNSENKCILDVCGDRGDLYFLLHACLKN